MILCHLKYGQIWRARVQVRTVREASFQVLEGVVYYVVCVAAMPLPYYTCD